MSISRYIIENEGSNPENIKLAFTEAFKQCLENDCRNLTLVFSSKSSFKSSDIATFLGKKRATQLHKGEEVDLESGIKLSFKIPRNISSYDKYGVILATYLTDKDMDVVDSVSDVRSVLFLPWNQKDGVRWLSTWSPETLGPSTWEGNESCLPTPVGNVIIKLGNSINMTTGLGHPSDKSYAKQLFKELQQEGHKATTEQVRQFAVNNGWRPKTAKELAKLAEKYIA